MKRVRRLERAVVVALDALGPAGMSIGVTGQEDVMPTLQILHEAIAWRMHSGVAIWVKNYRCSIHTDYVDLLEVN